MHLEKVLRANTEHLKKNKREYREKEKEKLERVHETLKKFRKMARLN